MRGDSCIATRIHSYKRKTRAGTFPDGHERTALNQTLQRSRIQGQSCTVLNPSERTVKDLESAVRDGLVAPLMFPRAAQRSFRSESIGTPDPGGSTGMRPRSRGRRVLPLDALRSPRHNRNVQYVTIMARMCIWPSD